MTTTTRPEAPFEAPQALDWYARADDRLEWRVLVSSEAARPCRHSTRRPCPNPAVAVLYRGPRRVAYGYCADHMYGRWIQEDVVMTWRLEPA